MEQGHQRGRIRVGHCALHLLGDEHALRSDTEQLECLCLHRLHLKHLLADRDALGRTGLPPVRHLVRRLVHELRRRLLAPNKRAALVRGLRLQLRHDRLRKRGEALQLESRGVSGERLLRLAHKPVVALHGALDHRQVHRG